MIPWGFARRFRRSGGRNLQRHAYLNVHHPNFPNDELLVPINIF
jgi:hypothetical protein